MNNSEAEGRSIKLGVLALIILTGLYMLMIFFNFTGKEEPEPEGIIVHLILFFKLNFSNITPIL